MSFLKSFLRTSSFAAVAAPLLAVAVVAGSLASSGNVPAPTSSTPAANAAKALSQAFREAASAVQPAVVMIRSEPAQPVKLEGKAPGGDEPSMELPFGERQFKGPSRGMPDLRRLLQRAAPQMPKHGQAGMGSGLVIDPSGRDPHQ